MLHEPSHVMTQTHRSHDIRSCHSSWQTFANFYKLKNYKMPGMFTTGSLLPYAVNLVQFSKLLAQAVYLEDKSVSRKKKKKNKNHWSLCQINFSLIWMFPQLCMPHNIEVKTQHWIDTFLEYQGLRTRLTHIYTDYMEYILSGYRE